MQEKCKTSCTYSRKMYALGPRPCVICGHPEHIRSLQEKTLTKIKRHFGKSASSLRNETNCIRLNTKVLIDKDIEFFKEIEGMYKEIQIKRSGMGIVTILNFSK